MTIVCGELVPKVFALRNKEWVCLRLSPTMRWFAFCVWPAVWLFERIVTAFMNWGERRWQSRLDAQGKPEADTLQELRAIAALARTSRLIGGREEGIILNAARLSSRSVREIVLPAEHIAMLSLSSSMADCLVAAHLDMHTRFPVTAQAGDPQGIVGYVNFKDIVAQLRLSPHEPSLRGILRPLTSLADSLPIASCLERMIREHAHIALVREPSGKVLGMITLEDIIEELVGEIHDEYDRLPAHVLASGSTWVVGGGTTITASAPRQEERTPNARGGEPTALCLRRIRHLGRFVLFRQATQHSAPTACPVPRRLRCMRSRPTRSECLSTWGTSLVAENSITCSRGPQASFKRSGSCPT